jgi:hypothetical protein
VTIQATRVTAIECILADAPVPSRCARPRMVLASLPV